MVVEMKKRMVVDSFFKPSETRLESTRASSCYTAMGNVRRRQRMRTEFPGAA